MSKTILADVDGFTPVIDRIADEFGLTTAAVFGKMWRYCQMEDGVCKASLDEISKGLGVDRATVQRHADKLCGSGYLKDLTPELRNRPHVYADTGKAGIRVKIGVAQRNVEGETVADSNVTVAQRNVTVAESQLNKVLKKDSQDIPLSIENSIFAGRPVNQTEFSKQKNEQDACLMFEKAFGFGKLPWSSTRPWELLTKFVARLYYDDPQVFGKYVIWRAGDGKFKAMSNKQIRTNPQAFIDTGWPEFESTTQVILSNSKTHVEVSKQIIAKIDEHQQRAVPMPDSVRAQLRGLTKKMEIEK